MQNLQIGEGLLLQLFKFLEFSNLKINIHFSGLVSFRQILTPFAGHVKTPPLHYLQDIHRRKSNHCYSKLSASSQFTREKKTVTRTNVFLKTKESIANKKEYKSQTTFIRKINRKLQMQSTRQKQVTINTEQNRGKITK